MTAKVQGAAAIFLPPLIQPLDAIKHLSWRIVGRWVLIGALLIGLLAMVLARVRPQLDAWWRQRRAAYLASEAYAFSRVRTAIRARNLSETLGAIDLWSAHLRDVRKDRLAPVTDALAQVGAGFYRGERTSPSDRQWLEVRHALMAARSEYLAAFRVRREASALPPINP